MDNPGSLDEFNELDEIMTPRPRIFEPYALDPIPNNPNRLRDAFLPDDSSEFSSLEDVNDSDSSSDDDHQEPLQRERAELQDW